MYRLSGNSRTKNTESKATRRDVADAKRWCYTQQEGYFHTINPEGDGWHHRVGVVRTKVGEGLSPIWEYVEGEGPTLKIAVDAALGMYKAKGKHV